MSSKTPPQRSSTRPEQPERPGAAVAQHQRRDVGAQPLVVGLQRRRADAVLEHRRAEHARVDDRLAGAVGAHRVHHVRGIAEQRDVAVDPAGHRVAVDHRVLEDLAGAAQHRRHVEPVEVPALEVVDELVHADAAVPVAVCPAAGVVDGDLGDPVDRRQAAVADRAARSGTAPRGAAGEPRPTNDAPLRIGTPGRDAAPHDRAAPLDRRLRRVHLRTHRRMQAVGGDQQPAVDLVDAGRHRASTRTVTPSLRLR